MNDEELLIYSRHLLLPEIGYEGQQRLRAARLAIVGVGGLGCPAAIYLAASGVGQITLIENDEIAIENLQRQILYGRQDIGQKKADSAQAKLTAAFPNIEIEVIQTRLIEENSSDIAWSNYDLILDCSDNFQTKYLLNKIAFTTETPLVLGAAIRFQGQVTLIDPTIENTPCYACLFPPTNVTELEACSENGVLSPLVGHIGSLQAIEAIKWITKIGQNLTGQLYCFDSLTAISKILHYEKDLACQICNS